MSEQTIFTAALELDPALRTAYLAEACGNDVELRQRVEKLLQLHEGTGVFMEQPAAADVGLTLDPPLERPGTQIGPYKLLQQIGEGGFGIVFMAEQVEPVRRRVALKIIKPGMDTRQVIVRFEAERQALAVMDHPNIARVLDAGATESGLPFFVMELVRGTPITQYCDENSLTIRERLQLFSSVCQAIQHAHTKGIIHRDIKPTNVLVTRQDGQPVVKVIDFGIAKAIGQQLTDKTLFTEFAQMIGTPLYMSPEQAELSSTDIDTRSDIYSLGVLLYELLTGSTPVSKEQLKQAAFDEIRRIIREDEPQRPSTRISSAEAAPSIAAVRSTEPSKLAKLVRGELDWIVMKSLEKDRARRYETATGLAADLQRYLDDEPVQASPPSAWYRLRKFVRRNRGPVLAVSLVLLALVAGMVGTTWNMMRAQRAKESAEKRLHQIERGTEILAAVFRNLDPRAAEQEGLTLRDLLGRQLDRAAQQLEGEAVGNPLLVAELQHVLGVSLRELGHLDQAQVVLVKACQTRERLLGADHLDTLATRHDLAVLYHDQGEYALAEPMLQHVLATRAALLGAEHTDTLQSKRRLALVYLHRAKYALAKQLFEDLLAIQTAQLGADHPDTLRSRHDLATTYHWEGDFAQSEARYQEVLKLRTARLGADHLDTAATKGNLAILYKTQGKNDLAEPLLNEVVKIRTAKLGADHAHTLASQLELAEVYRSLAKRDQGIALLEEVYQRRKAKLGPNHVDTLDAEAELGLSYFENRRFADAIPPLEEAYQQRSEVPELARVGYSLLTAYARAGKTNELTTLATERVDAARQQNAADSPQLATLLATTGQALVDGKEYALAEPLLRESLSIAEKQHPDAWDTHGVRSLLGEALVGQQKYAEAEPFLVQGYEGMKKHAANLPVQSQGYLTTALERLAYLYVVWDKPAEAARWQKELDSRRQAVQEMKAKQQ